MCHALGRYVKLMKSARPGHETPRNQDRDEPDGLSGSEARRASPAGWGVALRWAGLILVAGSCSVDMDGLTGDAGAIKLDSGISDRADRPDLGGGAGGT